MKRIYKHLKRFYNMSMFILIFIIKTSIKMFIVISIGIPISLVVFVTDYISNDEFFDEKYI